MVSPVVDIQNLSKFYGRTTGIKDVTFSIGEGEIFGFIGPNGAGKSTTIRILLNLLFPSGGSARVMGYDVVRESKKIRAVTGYIPSDANAYPNMTVEEFLVYSGRFYGSRNGAARRKELAGMFELDPSRRISDLSLGNRRKVSIVQALQHRPGLLIMDEPTTGLDPLIQSRFFDLLREENRSGMTIFFSSHILGEIQLLCGRVAIIRDGLIVNLENIDTLRRKQLKKITVWPANPAAGRKSLVPAGTEDTLTVTDDSLSYMYAGDINILLKMLSPAELLNLTIEEPSLEEIFMHYYK